MACETFKCDRDFQKLNLELRDLWDSETVMSDMEIPGALAQSMMREHGMRNVNEITQNGQCRGWNITWLEDCDYDGVQKLDDFSSDDCEMDTDDVGMVCNNEEYTRNCFMQDKGRSFTDEACTSRYMGINLAADRIMAGIKAMRKAHADNAVAFYTANANPITWQGTYGNVVGNQIEFTSAEFNYKLLTHLTNIARHEKCNNFKIIDDSNFYEHYLNSMQGACCDDQSGRNTFSRYNITFDTWLDETLGRRSTFMFNPKHFGYINTTRYTNSTPEVVFQNGENTVWGWYVEDPEWQILDMTGEGRGQLRNIRYDVEYKKECCGKDVLGKYLFKHIFQVSYSGGQYLSPTGCGDAHCIYEIVNIG